MDRRLQNIREIARSPKDFILLIRIAFWLAVQPVLIRTMPLDKLMKLLTPAPRTRRSPEMEKKAVRYTSFFLGKMTPADPEAPKTNSTNSVVRRSCLKRSMVLYRFLRIAGVPVKIKLGVQKNNGKLKGHCWLELGGKPYLQNEDMGYKTTYTYPPDSS